MTGRSDGEPPDAGSGGTNVLLEAPSFADAGDERCVRLLRRAPSPAAVLYVTLVQSPDRRLDAWRAHAGEPPSTVGFVTAGEPATPTRSAVRGATGDAGRAGPPGVPVETVAEPADLTGLGIAVGKVLDRWDDGRRPAVCLHSLTPLLQHADHERAFRFLHTLTGRLRRAGAAAHYHLDPGAHDRQTLHTLHPLFDAVVEAGEDRTVRTAPG